MAKAKKKIRIVERKLGREKAAGQWWVESNLIEIDPRISSKPYMDTCIHELLHSMMPELSEFHVKRMAAIITNGLWGQNFRRIMR